jgi:hypothetical protein
MFTNERRVSVKLCLKNPAWLPLDSNTVPCCIHLKSIASPQNTCEEEEEEDCKQLLLTVFSSHH